MSKCKALIAGIVVRHSPTGMSRRRAAGKDGRVIRLPVFMVVFERINSSALTKSRDVSDARVLRAGQSVRCSLRIEPLQED
jgi:hypothetical protein